MADFFSHLDVYASKACASTRSKMPAAGYVKTARPLLDGTTSKVVAGITPAEFIGLSPMFG